MTKPSHEPGAIAFGITTAGSQCRRKHVFNGGHKTYLLREVGVTLQQWPDWLACGGVRSCVTLLVSSVILRCGGVFLHNKKTVGAICNIAVLSDSISLSAHHHIRLSCFASLDALVPRVLECCVASCPAVSEPRTSTIAATEFAGFRDGATCEAYGADGRPQFLYQPPPGAQQLACSHF